MGTNHGQTVVLSSHVVLPLFDVLLLLDLLGLWYNGQGWSMLGVFGPFLLPSLIHKALKSSFYHHAFGSQDQILQTLLKQEKPSITREIGTQIVQLSN